MSDWVDGSPSLGSVFGGLLTGMADAPGKALTNIHTAESIKALRAKEVADAQEAARKAQEFNTSTSAGDAASAAIMAQPLRTQSVIGPMVGDMSNPADTAGVPTGNIVDPNAALEQKMFATAARAQALKDAGQLPGFYARTTFGTQGIPDDPRQAARLEAMNTGKVPSITGTPYVAKDKNGNTVQLLGASADGGLHDMTGKPFVLPPGTVAFPAGVASADPKTLPTQQGHAYSVVDPDTKQALYNYTSQGDGTVDSFGRKVTELYPNKWIVPSSPYNMNAEEVNPIGTPGAAENTLRKLAIRVRNGETLSPADAQTAGSAFFRSGISPHTVTRKNELGAEELVSGVMTNELPTTWKQLADHVNGVLFPAGAPAAAATPPAAAPATGAAGVLAAAGAAAGAPAAPAAPPAAAAPGAVPPAADSLFPKRVSATVGDSPPPSQPQMLMAANIERAEQHRKNIAEMITGNADGIVGGPRPDGSPGGAPKLPSLAAGYVNDIAGRSFVGGRMLNKLSPDDARYYNAVRQWIEPVIRAASGMAIHDTEYGNYYAMFVPQHGDSNALVQQKLDAMKAWANTLQRASGSVKDTLDAMKNTPEGRSPALRAQIEAMRVVATERGTIGKPVLSVVAPTATATPAVTAAPPSAVVPAAAAPADTPPAAAAADPMEGRTATGPDGAKMIRRGGEWRPL
jgi:hypothetical protein